MFSCAFTAVDYVVSTTFYHVSLEDVGHTESHGPEGWIIFVPIDLGWQHTRHYCMSLWMRINEGGGGGGGAWTFRFCFCFFMVYTGAGLLTFFLAISFLVVPFSFSRLVIWRRSLLRFCWCWSWLFDIERFRENESMNGTDAPKTPCDGFGL